MNWFWQILIQGLVVAGIITLAASVSWLPIQLFFVVLTLYVLYFISRNPRFRYSRVFQAVVVVALIPPSLSLRVRGWVSAPDGSGALQFLAELDNSAPAGLFIGLAFLSLVGDLVVGYQEEKRRIATYPGYTALPWEAKLVPHSIDTDLVRSYLTLRVASDLTLHGAALRVLTLWPVEFPCRVTVRLDELAPSIEPSDVLPVSITAGRTAQVLVEAELPKGRYRNWVRFRITHGLGKLVPLRAVLNLKSAPTVEPLPINLRSDQ